MQPVASAHGARRAEHAGGGRALIAAALQHQAPNGVVGGLRRRAACQRGLSAQGRRCRQRAHGPSGRAGAKGARIDTQCFQMPRGAAASAGLVAHRSCAGQDLPNGWLFPGLDPMEPLTARQLNRAVHDAAAAAGIAKRVTTHTLRHSLRHPSAGTQGRHPRHPGAAGPQEASRRHRSTLTWRPISCAR